MADVNLNKLLAKMQGVAKKKQLESRDLDVLREIREGVTQVLSALKVCDCCGAAVTEIARLELDGVRAAVCHDCGIKAFKNKALVLKKVKKNEIKREKREEKTPKEPKTIKEPKKNTDLKPAPRPETHSHHMQSALESKPQPSVGQTMLSLAPKSGVPDRNAAFEEIASETALKVPVVRKIFEIASSVAFPMAFGSTFSYAKAEIAGQGVKVTDDELKRALTGLVKKAGLRVKD